MPASTKAAKPKAVPMMLKVISKLFGLSVDNERILYVHDLYKSAMLTVDNKHILYVDHLYSASAQQ